MRDRPPLTREKHYLLRRRPVRYRRLGKRGRIVMLVDNAVVWDSRVQKQARSAADRGWDVVLLGCRRQSKSVGGPTRWRIGKARVHLLRFDEDMRRGRHELRGGWLRSPMAYPGMDFARSRQAENLGMISYLRFRVADAKGARGNVRRQWHRMRLRWAMRVQLPWIRWRTAKTETLARSRRQMTGWVDRMTTRWWGAALGREAWRRLDPQLLEYEAIYGPVVDELAPDIIHANDFRMLGVGARAVQRAAAQGREVKLVWDAHEFLPGLERGGPRAHRRWREAQLRHERRFAPYADAVITVTEGLATELTRTHGLAERPTVVLNAPLADRRVDRSVVGIRTRCGLKNEVPLFVYSGAASQRRGLDVMIETLPSLPEAHVALVVAFPVNGYVERLQRRARELGVEKRLHTLPYVPVDEIVPFLRSADFGVFPAHRNINHDLALPTKLFEYAQARLPVLVSDVRDTSEAVQAYGIGEVFRAEDAADYVRAARNLLDDPAPYQKAFDQLEVLEEWTWERQAERLAEVYKMVRRRTAPTGRGTSQVRSDVT